MCDSNPGKYCECMADKFRIGVVNPKTCGVGSEIPCNADEFCNGDAVGPICEPCKNHPTEDSCDEVGLPAEGAAACKARCPFDEKGNREEEEEKEPGYWCCSGQSGGPSYLNETVCARQLFAEHFFRSNALHCTATARVLIPAECSAVS